MFDVIWYQHRETQYLGGLKQDLKIIFSNENTEQEPAPVFEKKKEDDLNVTRCLDEDLCTDFKPKKKQKPKPIIKGKDKSKDKVKPPE